MIDAQPTIGVLYSCNACGLRDIEVRVPEREDQDIIAWMDAMTCHLGADHFRRSPHCHTDALTQVKIPLPPGSNKIGGGAVH